MRRVTLAGFINLQALGLSWILSSITGRHFLWGMPPAVGIELTNLCNLRCPECPTGNMTGKREKGFMDVSMIKKVVEELHPWIFNMNLYFQGEPMMHPDFPEIIEICSKTRATLSTNGHFLTDRNIDALACHFSGSLVVSLDGMERETYSRYRVGGDFDSVIAGIRNTSAAFKKRGSRATIVLQFLVSRHNENQADLARKFAREVNAAISFKSMQVINSNTHEYWLPAGMEYNRYIRKGGVYSIRSKLPRHCRRIWFNPVITWDGKVVPCCFDKDGDYILGDLKNESFRNIWYGKRFREFRMKVLKDRPEIGICQNCTEGMEAGIK